MSFLVDLIAMVFGMPRALFPEIAHVDFGGPEGGGLAFALLFAAIPIGAVIGGVFSGWVSRVQRQGLAVLACVIVWGLAMTGFGVAVGLADLAPRPHARRRGADARDRRRGRHGLGRVPDEHAAGAASDAVRGRLQGVFIVVVAGGPRIADVLHGSVAVVVGTAATAAGGGVLVVVVCPRGVRRPGLRALPGAAGRGGP